jgi:hypothetical protein
MVVPVRVEDDGSSQPGVAVAVVELSRRNQIELQITTLVSLSVRWSSKLA